MSCSAATETLKWIALVLMTGDHVNKYLLAGSVAGLYAAGRVALPLFVGVLAFNLSRSGCDASARVRMMKRLALAAAAATLPYTALGGGDLAGGWWPLNVLFTMLVITLTVHGIEQRTVHGVVLAVIAFLAGGALVEFWWPGVMLGLAAWWWFKHPNHRMSATALLALSAAGLCAINGNAWAFVALPLAAATLAAERSPAPRRIRGFFYAYYPAHLVALLGLRWATA